jgi:hypothetical protein
MPNILNSSGFPRTARPGLYTKVDASALAGGALDSGHLAIVGDFPTFPSSEPVNFSSRRSLVSFDPNNSDLSMIAQLCFNPSNDPNVGQGASSVWIVNTRENCTQATIEVGALTLKSKLYGVRGNATRSTLSLSGDEYKLIIDRGELSETFTADNTAVASIENNTGSQITVSVEEGTITVSSQGTDILTLTENEAYDLRSALTLIGQLDGISTTLIEPRVIPLAELDYFNEDIADSATLEIKAPNQELYSKLALSSLVDVAIDTASTAGVLTTGTEYASGGSQGVNTDIASAYSSIENVNIQIIVPFSFTEADQIALLDHLKNASNAGFERQAYVAIENTSDLSAVKSRSAKINSPSVALASQNIILYNAEGRKVEKDARFTAILYAGMQAGSDIGEPLTRKRPNVLGTKQVWDTHNDAEQALRSGTIFISQGSISLHIERSITTHLTDNNPILSEISAYESVLSSLRDIRLALSDQLGRPTKLSQIPLIESRVSARLGQQVRDGMIKAYANIQLEDLGDQVAVSYDLAPLEPLNFITVTAVAQRIVG